MAAFFWVFFGGGLGSVCRFLVSKAMGPAPTVFPWGTFWANAASCLLLGILVGLNLKGAIRPGQQYFLMIGFCGGFSTFSTFSFESFALLQDGRLGLAFLNMGGSMASGLVLIYLGIRLAG